MRQHKRPVAGLSFYIMRRRVSVGMLVRVFVVMVICSALYGVLLFTGMADDLFSDSESPLRSQPQSQSQSQTTFKAAVNVSAESGLYVQFDGTEGAIENYRYRTGLEAPSEDKLSYDISGDYVGVLEAYRQLTGRLDEAAEPETIRQIAEVLARYKDDLTQEIAVKNRHSLAPVLMFVGYDLNRRQLPGMETSFRDLSLIYENAASVLQQQERLFSLLFLSKLARDNRLLDEALGLLRSGNTSVLRVSNPLLYLNYTYNLAVTYYQRGLYDNALRNYFIVLSGIEGVDPSAFRKDREAVHALIEPLLTPNVYMDIGNTFHNLESYDEAVRFFQMAMDAYRIEDNTDRFLSALANKASSHRSSGDIETALSLYKSNEDLFETLGSPVTRAQFTMNVGNLYTSLNQHDEAAAWHARSLLISEEYGMDYGLMLGNLNIGFAKYKQGQLNEALQAYSRAAVYLETMDLPYEDRQLLKNLADLYAAKQQYERAFYYIDRYQQADRELISAEYKIAAEELKIMYELDLKDSQLELKEVQLAEKKTQLRLLWVLILGLVVIFSIIAIALYMRNEALKSLYSRNKELAKSEDLFKKFVMADAGKEKEKETVVENEQNNTLAKLFSEILLQFKDNEIYKMQDLTIGKLAELLSTNTTYVSRAITQYAEMNFNTFLNYHRVLEARRIILSSTDEYSTDDLIEICGFSSRASFYRAFSKHTGMSPSQLARIKKQDKQELETDMETETETETETQMATIDN